MTELTKYICDMCFKVAEMNTSPLRWESNYVLFGGMVVNLSRDMDIQALCPDCAHIVGDFIKSNRKHKPIELCHDEPKTYYQHDGLFKLNDMREGFRQTIQS